MNNVVSLTQEGLEKLKKELEELKTKKQPQAVERLQKARSMGDLSENSEYTSAKEDLEFIEQRIQELETIIQNVQIIQQGKNDQVVELGETIVLKKNDETVSYTIVGEYEADPMNGKISSTSPLGQALIGKKIGDQVEIKVPAGRVVYQIIDIKNH